MTESLGSLRCQGLSGGRARRHGRLADLQDACGDGVTCSPSSGSGTFRRSGGIRQSVTAVDAIKVVPLVGWSRWEATYDALHDDAVGWAVRITRDRSIAEDVVQDAFLQVFGRVRPLPSDEAVARYLRRAVVNAAFARLRADRRRGLREERAWAPPRPEAVDVDSTLWELVRALPRRQFTVLALRYWLDQTEAETARLMRCRVGTVKSLSARAVATLRKELPDG